MRTTSAGARRSWLRATVVAMCLLLAACSPARSEPTPRSSAAIEPGTAPPTMRGTAPPGPHAAEFGECDPSYPQVCIPPPPPDLDCDDVPFRNFAVTRGDPHGLDRDGDGHAC